MTAIVFHQGKLYGDRKQLTFTTPITFIDGPKVMMSRDGTFAYAVSGKTVTEVQRDKYEAMIRKIITAMIIEGSDRVKLSTIITDVEPDVDFTSAILCTRDEQFCIKETNTTFVIRLDGRTHGIGSGGPMLSTLFRCGLSSKEAFAQLPVLDYLSGTEFDTIEINHLESFVIKGTN